MRPILINGLGCFESGARVVLRELMKSYPGTQDAVLLMPSCNRHDLDGLGRKVRIIALNHHIFGRILRPLYEAALALAARLGLYSRVINLSHYGWCGGPNYILYFHNRLLLESGHEQWRGQGGRPNAFKRWCLHSCLEKADAIFVQTPHMAQQLREYATRRGITPHCIEVIEPLPVFAEVRAEKRQFAFQFFYPASVFPHKRTELAISAIVAAHLEDGRIGLVITIEPGVTVKPASSCISKVGTIPHEKVLAHFASSDALLFTSTYETLGLPLLEAMHFELPAVLPEKDYARAISGESAIYYREDTVEAVKEAILRCVREREKAVEAVRERRREVWAKRTTWAGHWGRFGVS